MINPEKLSSFIGEKLCHDKVVNSAVFNVLRTLKGTNTGDSYYENYLWHFNKRGDSFVDYYHLLWQIGANIPIKRILEIGSRTGISIAQLLASMVSFDGLKVVLCDIFGDGFISPALIQMNLKRLNIPADVIKNIEFLVGDSLVKIPEYKENNPDQLFDYILVDGNHDKEVAMQDLENVVDMLDTGGILMFDDIAPDGCNLGDVWHTFGQAHFSRFYFHENYEGKGIGVGIRK